MAEAIKTVVRFDHWVHPDMIERFAREPTVELVTLEQDDDETAWAAMGQAHAYQIASSRDELALHWHAGQALLERSPQMLCISAGGAGFDTIDVDACTQAGVLVVNQAGGNAQSVAEHTIGLMLDLTKRISETDRALRSARGYSRESLMGREMTGRTLGIIGFGNVGRSICRLAHAFDMTVLATDPYVEADTITGCGAKKVELDDLLSQSDIVSLNCPRDASTVGMLDARAFALMKSGAFLVTTCRGGVHDETALMAALSSGHLGGAGLDVWDLEPPPLDHPLLQLKNVVATFHTAGVTHEARGRMARYASDQAIAVLAGKYPPRLVNPKVWPAYAKRFEQIMGMPPEEGSQA